jgi:sigma-B regulation protein RsbU (phosphoserine phosphatase)
MASRAPLRRLLVVEDDPDQCRALRDRLEHYGYRVCCAKNGEAAVGMLQTKAFDGILLDLRLPTVQGGEVLRRAHEVCPDLPVLVLSASQSRIRAVQESQAAACGYIYKPFTIDELKQALHTCFGPAHEPVQT